MLNDTTNPKPPTPSLESLVARRQQNQSIEHIAHEIVNQLTVLNLVGSRILVCLAVGADAKLVRDAEIFQRSIAEATMLVQRLAADLQSQKKLSLDEAQSVPQVPGQIIRLLRGVSGQKR